MKRSKRQHLAVAGFFVVLAPAVLWATQAWLKQDTMASLVAGSELATRIYAGHLVHALHEYELLPAALAADSWVIDLLREPSLQARARANARLEALNRNIHAAAVYVLDEQGTALASSNWNLPESFVGHSYAFRPYFAQSMQGHAGRYVAACIASGEPGYYVSAPVRHAGRLLGVMVVKARLSGLELLFEGDETQFVVADRNGVIFLSSVPAWRFHTLGPLPAAVARDIASSHQYPEDELAPLPVTGKRAWGDTARILTVLRTDREGRQAPRDYFVRTSIVMQRGWQVLSFSTMDEVAERMLIGLVLASLTLLVALFMVLYVLQRRETLRRLREAAAKDLLTGLYTRRHMLEREADLVGPQERDPASGLAAVMMDVDRFKQVNDTYGHKAGDQVLARVAQSLRSMLRAGDLAVRYGGEEFLVLGRVSPGEDLKPFAERVRRAVKSLSLPGLHPPLTVTLSAGIAYRRQGEALDALVARADVALYKAKNDGRDCVRVDPEAPPPAPQAQPG